MTDALMATYSRLPVRFARGEGVWLWDDQGNKYLDALAGIAVSVLGHLHPAVCAAIRAQSNDLLHTSNLYVIDRQRALAETLVRISGLERVFFCNSGAEANEAAIKIARACGHASRIDAPEIIVAEGAFHGRTLATLSASGSRRVQAGFEPLVSGFVRVPFNDLSAIETVAANRPNVVAILLEPIQGEGGVVVPDEDYLDGVRRLCDRHGWLMMLDEVQTGNARTGRWFAWQHSNAVPDVVTLSKGLANGVPIGACMARGPAANALQPGSHGSTFGGNPFACGIAQAVLGTIETEQLADRATRMGAVLMSGLRTALGAESDESVKIRGRGLMIGIEFEHPCAGLAQLALERGLLINVTAERVVRLLPPLVISEDEIEQLIQSLTDVLSDFRTRP